MDKQRTILIIDDDPSNIQLMLNYFKQANVNYKVLSSSNSKLGLEISLKSLPDIIITDWQMPELNGIELIQQLKRNSVTKEIPVIMATGIKMSSYDLKTALDNGAFDFIRKPIDDIELIARVNSALRFIYYHNEKLLFEKEKANMRHEVAQTEIEVKKKELLSKTMMLLKINKLNEQFQQQLDFSVCEKDKIDCNIYCYAKKQMAEIMQTGNQHIWSELETHFEQINEAFYKSLYVEYPHLTSNEKRLCAYLRLNLTTKEISNITTQSIRSIEIARTRLREKLGLKGTDGDLHSYLLKF